MNIPKVVRGGFFGIFIPGAFLLINILLVFSIDIPIVSTVREDGKTSTMSAEKDIRTSESILGSIEKGFLYVVLAFTLGIALRVLPISKIAIFGDEFPYFRYFFQNKKRMKFVRQFTDFYCRFVQNEYPTANEANWRDIIIDNQKDISMSWINYFKTYIYSESGALREEILYLEGLSRFICGMCYAILLSMIVLSIGLIGTHCNWPQIAILSSNIILLLVLYFVILIVFLLNITKVRGREVCTTLEAFALLYKENE